MGSVVGLVVVGGLFFVTLARGRRSSHTDETASSCVQANKQNGKENTTAELEALRLRVAVLSARLANAERCRTIAPTVAAVEERAPPALEPDVDPDERDPRPAAPSDASVADASHTVASADAETLPALPTAWATETFLRELAHAAAPDLTVSEVVCSEALCRLSVSGRGTPENDALALQSLVGRTAERLPNTFIQPGLNGAASVVLVARPGYELPDSRKQTLPDSPKLD